MNQRDATGSEVSTTKVGSFYITNVKTGKRYLLPIKWIREHQLEPALPQQPRWPHIAQYAL